MNAEFLFKPGLTFSKEDLDDVIKLSMQYSWKKKTYYMIYNASTFCIEEDKKRVYRFLFDPLTTYDETTFLRIGKNPHLLLLK